jgi:hypothetical protein
MIDLSINQSIFVLVFGAVGTRSPKMKLLVYKPNCLTRKGLPDEKLYQFEEVRRCTSVINHSRVLSNLAVPF